MTKINFKKITDLPTGNPTDNARLVYREAGADRQVSVQALRTLLVGVEQQVLVSPALVTAVSISALRIVAINNNNQWVLADNTNANHAGRVGGISVTAWGIGDTARMVVSGTVFDSTWNWTSGRLLYLGTGGLLTQTPPNPNTAAFIQVLGTALSPQRISFSIGNIFLIG